MHSKTPTHAAAMAASSPPQPPGQRSGEGAASVLPCLHEDADQRPEPAGTRPGEAGGTGQGPSSQRRVGRYLVSALVSSSGNGWFASAVSIRSGSGSATTDRVLRLTRLSRSAREAAARAHAEALRWIGAPRRRALVA